MWREMSHHHYVLQYHIYAVALHRYVDARIPDYEYESNFGGAIYGFLRGIDGDNGWFVDRPTSDLIDALDLFFGGKGDA